MKRAVVLIVAAFVAAVWGFCPEAGHDNASSLLLALRSLRP